MPTARGNLPQISQICAESGSGCLWHVLVAHRLHGFHRFGTDEGRSSAFCRLTARSGFWVGQVLGFF